MTFRKNNIPLEIAKNVSPVFAQAKSPPAIANDPISTNLDKPLKTPKQKMPPIFMNQVIKGVEVRKASLKMKRHTIDTCNILNNDSIQSMMHTTKNSFRADNLADHSNADLLPDINGEVNCKF